MEEKRAEHFKSLWNVAILFTYNFISWNKYGKKTAWVCDDNPCIWPKVIIVMIVWKGQKWSLQHGRYPEQLCKLKPFTKSPVSLNSGPEGQILNAWWQQVTFSVAAAHWVENTFADRGGIFWCISWFNTALKRSLFECKTQTNNSVGERSPAQPLNGASVTFLIP